MNGKMLLFSQICDMNKLPPPPLKDVLHLTLTLLSSNLLTSFVLGYNLTPAILRLHELPCKVLPKTYMPCMSAACLSVCCDVSHRSLCWLYCRVDQWRIQESLLLLSACQGHVTRPLDLVSVSGAPEHFRMFPRLP